MSDSVKELILKNIKTTLESISTIKNVQRFQVQGNDTGIRPCIIIIQGEVSTLGEAPDPQVEKEMQVFLDVFDKQDIETDSRNADEIMNIHESNIEAALQLQPNRGGYATDTSPLDVLPLTVAAKGATAIETEMRFNIIYRHNRQDQTRIV